MPKRWAIQVVDAEGNVMYLRHGNRIGAGPIATFGTRKLAEINREFIEQGMDAGVTVNVVAHSKFGGPAKE